MRTSWIVLLASCLTSALAYADVQFGLGAGTKYFRYWEHLPAPSKSEQYAAIPRASLSIEARPNSRSWFLLLKADYAHGLLKYDGTTQPPDSTPITQVNEHRFVIFDAQLGLRLGSILGVEETHLYVGASHRTWYRMLPNPNETYRLISSVGGIRILPKNKTGGNFGLDISYRKMVKGDLTAATREYDEAKFKLKPAAGFRIELPIFLSGSPTSSVALVPWYEQSAIAKSDLQPLTLGGVQQQISGQPAWVYEPSSTTQEIGLDLVYQFSI